MENIYAIIISDFAEKIHFFQKKMTFDYEKCLDIVKSLNKSLSSNYLKEFVSSGLEIRGMDTMINPKLKMKITIASEVLIEVLYDSNVDFNYLNIINHSLLEGLFYVAKTKKLKLELLNRRYQEVNQVLEDTLYLIDPRVRLNSKNGLINLKEPFNVSRNLFTILIKHTIYSMKFNIGAGNLRNLVLHQSVKDFEIVKESIENSKKLKIKNSQMNIPLNNNLVKVLKLNRKMHLNDYAISPQKKVNKIKTNKVNANNISDKNKEGDMLIDIDFNLLPQETRPSSSFNGGNLQNGENQFNSNNFIGIGGTKLKNFDNIKDIQQENGKKVSSLDAIDSTNNLSSVEKSISSLAQVDLTGLLESINFDKSSNDNGFSKIESIQNKIISSSMLGEPNIYNSMASSSTNYKYSENLIANIDFNLSKNTSSNFNLNENIYRTENPSVITSRKNLDFSNFDDLLQISTTKDEDRFDKSLIRKQVRGVIIEKGILMNNKGKYEDVKYRGQIALELTSNFQIQNKTFFLKVFHPNWNESNSFIKLIPDRNLVEDHHHGNYKISCHDVKSFLRLIDYNINIKMIEPAADFKVTGTHKEDKYKLEIKSVVNKKMSQDMKGSQMSIVIITKSCQIEIIKATNTAYTIEDKIINYTIKEFNQEERILIGIVFKTPDKEFVEVVRITYKYMDVLPTSNNAELLIYDEFNKPFALDVMKKCQVEVRFLP